MHANNLTWFLSRPVHVPTTWCQRFSITSNRQGSQLRAKWRFLTGVTIRFEFLVKIFQVLSRSHSDDGGPLSVATRPSRGIIPQKGSVRRCGSSITTQMRHRRPSVGAHKPTITLSRIPDYANHNDRTRKQAKIVFVPFHHNDR